MIKCVAFGAVVAIVAFLFLSIGLDFIHARYLVMTSQPEGTPWTKEVASFVLFLSLVFSVIAGVATAVYKWGNK